jgi:hypothetical protein
MKFYDVVAETNLGEREVGGVGIYGAADSALAV